ncbi:MAG: branched-chain amino acid ABC transporter substrate-binding protein [Cellvibrionaceae bacterium]
MRNFILFFMFLGLSSSFVQSAEDNTIKIAYLDPLSGAFSVTGYNGLYQFQFAIDELVNKKGGVLGGKKFELVSYDSQASPKEALLQLKRITGEGIRFVFHGNSSAVANALSDAISKHNRRNPDERIIYLNYSAVDPALTNENCNFWHFRLDAHGDIKMEALTDMLKDRPEIKKIYVIGQDYSFGKAVAQSAEKLLAEKRPDIKIVGNELHPMERVKDFTPYITKIKSSGADAVITGNWGADMLGLSKGIIDAGLDIPIFTYYGSHEGNTAAFGESGVGRIRVVHNGQSNPSANEFSRQYHKAYKAKYPDSDITNQRTHIGILMLSQAIEKAGTTDPLKVALALENMKTTSIDGTDLWMRPSDHQLFQPITISVHSDDVEFDADNSGYGLKTEKIVSLEDTVTDTTCKMRRPRN